MQSEFIFLCHRPTPPLLEKSRKRPANIFSPNCARRAQHLLISHSCYRQQFLHRSSKVQCPIAIWFQTSQDAKQAREAQTWASSMNCYKKTFLPFYFLLNGFLCILPFQFRTLIICIFCSVHVYGELQVVAASLRENQRQETGPCLCTHTLLVVLAVCTYEHKYTHKI